MYEIDEPFSYGQILRLLLKIIILIVNILYSTQDLITIKTREGFKLA